MCCRGEIPKEVYHIGPITPTQPPLRRKKGACGALKVSDDLFSPVTPPEPGGSVPRPPEPRDAWIDID